MDIIDFEAEVEETASKYNHLLTDIYTEYFKAMSEKQSFSYFIGGTVILYKNIFRFLNIDYPMCPIFKISDVNTFISYKSPLLSRKSETFRKLLIETLFSPKSLPSFDKFKENMKFNITFTFARFFLNYSNFYNFEDLSELIFENLSYDKKDFENFYMSNYEHFCYGTKEYFDKSNYEKNVLIYYAVKIMVEDFFSKIDDIDSIMLDFYQLYKTFNSIIKKKSHINCINFLEENRGSKFNRVINFHYKKHFGDHIENMIKVRQYHAYNNIGEETIKNMSYFKTSNMSINKNVKYNNMIENNIEAYHRALSEYPNIFHLSYSLLGFIGDSQLKEFKNLMRKPLDEQILELKIKEEEKNKKYNNNTYYRMNQEVFYETRFPLTKNGWKFLIKQNKNYALRFSRNLKVSTICANLECHDAWLRSSSLKRIVNNNVIYYSAYNIIMKSILAHNGPVSQYTGFENIYIYNNLEKPRKIHLNVILDCIKNSINELKTDRISNINMVNILFFLFDKFYYFDLTPEISEKYSNLYNIINELKYNIEDKSFDFENELINDEIVFHRNRNLEISINKKNKNFILKKINPVLKELETFLNEKLKNCYRKNFSKFNEIMTIFYNIEENNTYNNDYEENIKSKYISIEHALQRISDFINFNYINKFPENNLITSLNINSRLYVNNHIMKNIKSLDHLFELANKWHKKEEERKLAEINNVNFDLKFLFSLPEFKENLFFEFKGLKFFPIQNSVEMYKEKLEMKHCIYQYTDYCIDKTYLAFRVIPDSVNVFDKSSGFVRATLGCNRRNDVLSNDVLTFDQTYSFCDADVSSNQKEISVDFLKHLNLKTFKIQRKKENEFSA